jgi:hypothetical protein
MTDPGHRAKEESEQDAPDQNHNPCCVAHV